MNRFQIALIENSTFGKLSTHSDWMYRLSERTGVQIGPAVCLGQCTTQEAQDELKDEYRTGLDSVPAASGEQEDGTNGNRKE